LSDITVTDYEQVEIMSQSDELVPGQELELNAGAGYDNYDWRREKTGDEVINNWSQTLDISEPGTYNVTATKYGIVSRDTIQIAKSLPKPDYITAQDTLICNMSTTMHTVPVQSQVNRYVWTLDPRNAGTIESNTAGLNEVVQVDWNNDYYGDATLKAQAMYNNSELSDTAKLSLVLDACLGIEGQSTEDQVSVYPNPASEQFTVSVPAIQSPVTIKILNANGVLVRQEDLKQNNAVVDVHDLASGMYFIEITGDSYNVRKKVVIK